jgi:hypothetical protein
MKRKRIMVSLNETELNELWLIAWQGVGSVGESMTIKRCLADSIMLKKLQKASDEKGINLQKFLGI